MPATLLSASEVRTSNITADIAVVTNNRLTVISMDKAGSGGELLKRALSYPEECPRICPVGILQL
ncbi:hypothetical protein, partial [Massilia alkalitolerans]|uniref:hypothetical protein n=1 Tax=Massilia alkalitolerans TaxID=286638 RepID=UPI0028A6A73C